MIRRLKSVYALYNFFHKKELMHNVELYERLGLKKKYYSPVSSKDFEDLDEGLLKKTGSAFKLNDTRLFKGADAETQRSLSEFDEKGYSILRGYFSGSKMDEINSLIESGLKTGLLKFKSNNKIMFALHQIAPIKQLGETSELIELLSTMVGGEVRLFQSINFLHGSEQKTHSDSIHMTTFPLGGLLGVWVALEDIDADNGPLHYYPGSHKLPYYLNADYQNEGSRFLLGDKGYAAYEKMIEGKIEEKGLKKEVFIAKKGDVLIWHANLFHGGEKHLDRSRTRKSMVFHYYMKDSICYHEITQRPALLK
jgi:phytanoyl-CoA hydroxylase